MATKENLLSLLEEKKGGWVSGEEIGERLNVSRTAVWKAVNALRKSGYQIQGAQNKGYCLSAQTDILTENGIRKHLAPAYAQMGLEVLATASSTNAILRQKANEGCSEGCAVIAGAQSQGRGRLGRTFYSPPDTGIYLSLLLRPEGFSPQQAVQVTTMAAVAACRAIESVSGRSPQIKWVNDVFLDGKKVCGILTEGAFHLETGSMDYIVLGVGINAYAPREGFPEELAQIAGAVFDAPRDDGKNRLTAEFLNAFLDLYYRTAPGDYAQEYRQKSLVIGKQIMVITASGQRPAVALDVDRDCRLIVRNEDGSIEHLSSAEVSIRA